jgi:hypothetical protein
MKLFFVKGEEGYDEEDPILVLADTKKEAESLANGKNIFLNNTLRIKGKAGRGYKLKKGVIWKQFNAG